MISPMDTITICDLEVFYHVGVPDEERARPQRLLLTVEMDLDFTEAATSDNLRATVDYASVSRQLQSFGEGRSWKLIETLAVDIAALVSVLADQTPQAVRVEVKKFILPETRFVSVKVERQKTG